MQKYPVRMTIKRSHIPPGMLNFTGFLQMTLPSVWTAGTALEMLNLAEQQRSVCPTKARPASLPLSRCGLKHYKHQLKTAACLPYSNALIISYLIFKKMHPSTIRNYNFIIDCDFTLYCSKVMVKTFLKCHIKTIIFLLIKL